MDKILAYSRVSEPIIQKLKQKYDVVYFKDREYLENKRFREELKNTTGIIGIELQVTKELLNAAPQLKIVANVSVGYDNLDLIELKTRGIMATNTPGVLNHTVADGMVGLMLATARKIPALDHYVKVGQWRDYLQIENFGVDVHHKTVGIIGMGGIGEEIAKRCHFGFDMNVVYYNRSRNENAERKYEATYSTFNEVLEQADFLFLMVPATNETKKMMNKDAFARMKRTAIFINGSRGQNVDEKALYDALTSGEIRAAGLDVYKEEPVPLSNPLLRLKNIVTLPHIGPATEENELAMSTLAAENLVTGLEGGKPKHLIV